MIKFFHFHAFQKDKLENWGLMTIESNRYD